MVKLFELAAGVPGAVVEAGGDFEVTGICYDSRRVQAGDLFVARTGLHTDAHDYAADAAAAGAALGVEKVVTVPAGTPLIRLPNARAGLAELAAAFYGHPSRRLRVAGITGTDGKTTSTHMAAHVLDASGTPAGAMSTIALRLGAEETDNLSGQTTMEPPEIQECLARMVRAGIECAVIEVTSHALIQERVAACDFDVAAFTNVGFDHLDYHSTWDDYVRAKAALIDLCGASASKGLDKTAVLNRDDVSYPHLAERPIARRWSYSIQEDRAEIRAVNLSGDATGSRFKLVTPAGAADVELHLPARFNVYNALCAAGVCVALGIAVDDVAAGLSSFQGVRGRLEAVDLGQDFRVYIDFAHSAGSLASVLTALRPFTEGRLIAVFGSTARSDHDRPGMGRAAAAGADYFVITTDDPVDQDPAEIAREVQSGVEGREPGRDYQIVLDRRAAIRAAIGAAAPGDVVLLAGKGHERSMMMRTGKEPWDERAVAEAAIRERLGSPA